MRLCGYVGISFNIILCTFVGDLVQFCNFVVLLRLYVSDVLGQVPLNYDLITDG